MYQETVENLGVIKLLQEGTSPAIRQQGAHSRKHALIFGRAAVGHDLCNGGKRFAQAHTASARLEAGGANLHHTEQRPQPPVAPVLQGPLRRTTRAAAPDLAMLLSLSLHEVALACRHDLLGFRQPETQGLS
jgi:hypothetical protein